MYHVGDGARTVILNHTPGYGQLELASLRKDIPCISIVANCKHRVILEQRLILTIMLEGLRGQTRLLRGRRVLSMQRSIGGGHDDPHVEALQHGMAEQGPAAKGEQDDKKLADNASQEDEDFDMSDEASLAG